MSAAQPDAYYRDLEASIEKIWEIARRFNLDPFPVNFELVPPHIMYEFAAYGLPGRFNHWSRGKAYFRMKTEYDYGLSKIYELVVNTNPSYAFLMEQNDLLQNKVVVAHVLGHTDMFKNNAYFQHTARDMISHVSVNAERVRRYEFDHGREPVERFLDAVLAIQEHIDPNISIEQTKKRAPVRKRGKSDSTQHRDPYADLFPGEKARAAQAEEEARRAAEPKRVPAEPQKDLLMFFAEHAPNLEDWQRDLLLIVRDEMRYFVPQMQTKILNEGWACLTGSSLVVTDHGLLRYDALHRELAHGREISVASGTETRDVITDRHIRRNAQTVKLRTRLGFEIEGATEHRLRLADGSWADLRDVRPGQRVPLMAGMDLWASEPVSLAGPLQQAAQDDSLLERARREWLTIRLHCRAQNPSVAALLASAQPVAIIPGDEPELVLHTQYEFHRHMLSRDYALEVVGKAASKVLDAPLRVRVKSSATGVEVAEPASAVVDEKLAAWLGAFMAGHALGSTLVGALGLDDADSVPEVILRSPGQVVRAFLRGWYDAGAWMHDDGIALAAPSEDAAATAQLLLLNLDVLARRAGSRLVIPWGEAAAFMREVGFGVASKAVACGLCLSVHPEAKPLRREDEVVAVEDGVADVYDITVDESHQYVAQGMLHHNSFWHSRIIRELDLSDADHANFAQMHAGVLASSRTHMNPYLVGYRILEDIERRWDNPTEEERVRLGRQLGQGRAKIFEVREVESDLSLIRNYLTKELVHDLDLYLYAKNDDDEWVIVEQNWEKVRDGITASMTNFGSPYITVVDANFNDAGELLLRHHFEGQDLDLRYAEKTLEHVYFIWSKPVHLETTYEEQKWRLSYDGTEHDRNLLPDDEDDEDEDDE